MDLLNVVLVLIVVDSNTHFFNIVNNILSNQEPKKTFF